ncbi:hypothetical protein HJFPF1_03963 [Paramyrothecium foliicola]|nr:hypothetical protein HJFPF1_03963 [Paramyrothecium foliicola]
MGILRLELVMTTSESVRYQSEHGSNKKMMRKTTNNCRLENLPAEMRRHILLALELPQLRALVLASPTYHAQYWLEPAMFLCQSLQATLSSVAVDAYAIQLHKSRVYDHTEFMEWYANKTAQQSMSLQGTLDYMDAKAMSEIYFQSADIRDLFAQSMLNELDENATRAAPMHIQHKQQELTRTEQMRLLRAIYRFELLCHLTNSFGQVPTSESSRTKAFLALLEPWEIEELFTFYLYAQDTYDNLLVELRWDLHPNNPKFNDQGRAPTTDGAFNLSNTWNRACFLEGTTLQGLNLLHTVLFWKSGRERLVSVMQEHIRRSYIPMDEATGIFGETAQYTRCNNERSERDVLQEVRSPFPFRGDDDPRAPPLAWTLIWRGTYSNLYGCYIPDEMRRWGYVFWDAARLESTAGKEILEVQWAELNDDEDPRDHLL